MTAHCAVYIAASVDGFIARPDGDIAWLENPEYRTGESYGLSYDEFIATVDVLVMGRGTFEKVLTFGGWPYEGTPVVVLSTREVPIPDHLEGKVSVDRGDPEAVVERLATRGMNRLYVDGGVTIQRFLLAGLIDELTVTWIPILLGDGIPLFGTIGRELPLTLVETTSAAGNGFVQTRYRVG